jgi:hypothetical protein
MNIQLHIERLVLEGLPMSQHQSALVHAAVKKELGRLLDRNGWRNAGAPRRRDSRREQRKSDAARYANRRRRVFGDQ